MPSHGLRVVRVCLVFLSFLSALAGTARAEERIELVSRALPGLVSDTGGWQSSLADLGPGTVHQKMSADGRYVVFVSQAPNLVAGQVENNTDSDVFLYDRVAGTLRLVSHALAGPNITGNFGSTAPSISADGRYIAFASHATDLATTANTNNNSDVFVFDRETGTVTLASHRADISDEEGDGPSHRPMISTDGNWVVFESRARNLVTGQVDLNSSREDIFLWERATNTSTLVSHQGTGLVIRTGNSNSTLPTISADGSWVAFISSANDLVVGIADSNNTSDAFLWERATNTNRLVSRSSASALTTGDRFASFAHLSADGAWVLFYSHGTNHVADQIDTNNAADAFLFSRDTGEVTLVSHSAAGVSTTSDGAVMDPPFLSADGQWVVFASSGSNHVTGQIDTNRAGDIFLWSRASQTIELVSRQAGTTATAATSEASFTYRAVVSADGARVAYAHIATDLVAGQSDANNQLDLFLFDRATGTNALLSSSGGSATTASNNTSEVPVFSADGRWVAFVSTASDLLSGVMDSNSTGDVFLHDCSSGTTGLVSRRDAASPSATAGGPSLAPYVSSFSPPFVFVPLDSLSADGRYLAFQSATDRMVPGQVDRNGTGDDVFFHDRRTGGITLVSHAAGTLTETGNSTSQTPVISADGRWVAFVSRAANLVDGQVDTAGTEDVFLWDSQTGTTILVSHTAASPVTAAGGSNPVLAADGSAVAFLSYGTDLVAGQTDSAFTTDVFLFDRTTGANRLVSYQSTGPTVTAGGSSAPWISADGQSVAFLSSSSTVVAGQVDTGGNDLFQWDRTTGAVTLVSSGSASATTAIGASFPAQSADGNWLAFSSSSNAVIPGLTDTNGTLDIFLWERATGTKRLVSHAVASPTATSNSASFGVRLNANGSRAVFLSYSTGLVSGTDTNNSPDAFVFDRATEMVSLASHSSEGATTAGNGEVYHVGISADGSRVSFLSSATNLVNGQTDPSPTLDLFRYDPATGEVGLLSRRHTSASAAGTASNPGPMSANGSVVVFTSADAAIVPNDYNGRQDVFVWTDETPADLTVSMTDTPDPVERGATLTYVISVTNAGPSAAASVTVTDTLPAGVTFVSAGGGGWSCGESGGVVTCTRPSLAPGSAPDVTVQVTAPVTRGFATLTNTVAVTSSTADPVADNEASTETSVPQPGVTVTPVSGLVTTEAGGTGTFTVVLGSAPLADVTIALASSDPSEGTSDPASLTFTPGSWSMPQTVTVTGVDDDLGDEAVAYTIVLQPAESGDAAFDGLDPADVTATNQDDDTEGLTHIITPCRAVDTRQSGFSAALKSGQVTLLQLRGNCGVPSIAQSVAINLTYVGATQSGQILVYPGNLAQPPLPEVMSVVAGRARSLLLFMPLGSDGTLAILPVLQASDPVATVHVVLDVSGYFE